MKLVARFWNAITYFISTKTLTPRTPALEEALTLGRAAFSNGGHSLTFSPPTSSPYDGFHCDYSAMGKDWQPCSTPENRGCWLRNKVTKKEYNIFTDYEFEAPQGVTRYYSLNITNGEINADGVNFPQAKMYNSTYPAPLIQACWGDRIVVKVTNQMTGNGTTIHWHGLRQLGSMQMDGVNGLDGAKKILSVTQCPIAPQDYFVYAFNVTQYGSSWYHSHYSVQYADGAAGPLTLHGPSSANYDESIYPLIMTDHVHNSAFEWLVDAKEDIHSILLDGRGNVTRFNHNHKANLRIPEPYTIHFEPANSTGLGRAKRYLLRLINTSFAASFVVSIDNHKLQMVGADFVPIEPYTHTHVLVAIGQRYHVIVEADPQTSDAGTPPPSDGNFWIRTWVATGCGTTGDSGYERTGILRYNSKSKSDPTSRPWTDVKTSCSDEEYNNLHPIVKWEVGAPANKRMDHDFGEWFGVGGYNGQYYPVSFFSLGERPFRINYSDPMFVHLQEQSYWNPAWAVIPEDYNSTDWVWMVIQARRGQQNFGPHPLHLHGHDFAILQQANGETFDGNMNGFKLDNPPRRDVVLLPHGGFVAIAFRTDNPGSWLVHCHIAAHVAGGLGMQILERQRAASRLWPPGSHSQAEAERVCANWREWKNDCNNWSNGCPSKNSTDMFQNDSGV